MPSMSIGTSSSSIGGTSDLNASSVGAHGDASSMDHLGGDAAVTHFRGRVDDIVRHLQQIRGAVTPEIVAGMGADLDDVDARVEGMREQIAALDL